MGDIKFQPVIKWTGSKRSQLKEILKYIPDEIDTYYEPFCGSAAVLRGVIESKKKVNRYVCSDINRDLITLWEEIKARPEEVYKHYEELWGGLIALGDSQEGITNKKEYYYKIRTRFNKERNPLDFMFIMRTTTNGMPRYNKKGEFNNSYHVTRNGMRPERLKKIIYEWSNILKEKEVEFETKDYREIVTREKDFMYLDPPYANTKGIYYGKLDYTDLWRWLKHQEARYILSFDGKSGAEDNTYAVPTELYQKHIYITSGNSSFKRILVGETESIVRESLYIK